MKELKQLTKIMLLCLMPLSLLQCNKYELLQFVNEYDNSSSNTESPKDKTSNIIDKYNNINLKESNGRKNLTFVKITKYTGNINCNFDLRWLHGIDIIQNGSRVSPVLQLDYVINDDGKLHVTSQYTRNNRDSTEQLSHTNIHILTDRICDNDGWYRLGQDELVFTFTNGDFKTLYIE